jgi:arsenate reductase
VAVKSLPDEASKALSAWLAGRDVAAARGPQPPLLLFVCHSNTALSIMAEAMLEHLAEARLRAASAGKMPATRINPYALACLRGHGIATRGLRSKPWDEFFGLGRQPVRFVIALGSGYAANASWDRSTLVARWEMPDPAAVVGSEEDIRFAFEKTFAGLGSRIRSLLALPLDRLTDQVMLQELALIGEKP